MAANSPRTLMTLLGLLLFGAGQAQAQEPIFIDGIVSIVGGDIITNSELQDAKAILMSDPSMASIPPDELEGEILTRLIEDHLISQSAAEQGIQIGEDELDGYINAWLQQNGVTQDVLMEELTRQNLTWEEYRGNMRKSMLQSRFIDYIISPKISVTEAQVKSYYAREVSAVKKEDAAEVLVVFIAIGPDGAEAAKVKANDIYQVLVDGADFADTAKLNSDHPSAASGGSLGTFKRGELFKALDSAVFSLQEGEISRPIASPQGYFIAMAKPTQVSDTISFEEARPQIENLLYQQEMERQMALWVESARRNAHIEIMEPYKEADRSKP